MSNCHCEGKYTIIFTKKEGEGKDIATFVSKEDHMKPSKVQLPEPEPSPGIYNPDGSINWQCPCMSRMVTGPCAVEFREAFSCFQTLKTLNPTELKVSKCTLSMDAMRKCLDRYPTLYERQDEEDSSLDEMDQNPNNTVKNKDNLE